MKYLDDIKIQTAIDVNEVLDHITSLENGLNTADIGPVLYGWMETRLKGNLNWISESRKELQGAKEKFKDDSETREKIEYGLNELHIVESKIRGMIRCSDELKAQGHK
ncbi:hypothetical protein F5Y06DRAFT_291801 [Hypoxylon sp. FL0890]|nr:hypothetical protein F5Y06DRAFT_291801 [Hypoxylon sp. FL0890]